MFRGTSVPEAVFPFPGLLSQKPASHSLTQILFNWKHLHCTFISVLYKVLYWEWVQLVVSSQSTTKMCICWLQI